MEIIKISATSVPKAVAGAIAARLADSEELEVKAVGAKAVNQAVKALIVTRTYCAQFDSDIIIQPSFTTAESATESIIGICLLVKRIPLADKEA